MSEDSKLFDAGDYNLFRYCHNDPLDFTDPMGLDSSDNPALDHGANTKANDQQTSQQKLANQMAHAAARSRAYAHAHGWPGQNIGPIAFENYRMGHEITAVKNFDLRSLGTMRTSSGKELPVIRDDDFKDQLWNVSNRIGLVKDPRSMNSQQRANFLLALDTGFRTLGQFYYAGSLYGKAGIYEGNAANYIGIGEGLAALGVWRIGMYPRVSYWKGSQWLLGHSEKLWSSGTFHFTNVGYDFYQANH